MTATNLSTSAPAAGFCTEAYKAASEAGRWVQTTSKSFAASAGDVLSRMWATVSEFFSSIAQTLGQWFNAAKEGLGAATESFRNSPTNVKVAAGVAMLASTVLGFFFARCCNSATPSPASPPLAAQTPVVVVPPQTPQPPATPPHA